MASQKFNKVIESCVKDIELQDEKSNRVYTFNTEKDYLDNLKAVTKDFKLTAAKKKTIDCILYNSRNSDGLFSATIAYHALKSDSKNGLTLLRVGSGWRGLRQRTLASLKDKNVLILDLSYKSEEYKQLSVICKSIVALDDHDAVDVGGLNNVTLFTSNHAAAACAVTWMVFFPKKQIPKLVQYIDLKDRGASVSARHLSNVATTVSAITFRYTANPYLTSDKWASGTVLDELWVVIEADSSNFWTIIGTYMHEVQENIKMQIAQNAQIRTFQGYKVGVLNFGDPVITKRVGRQICTNKGDAIDFAVLWAYEYSNGFYKVTLIDDHKPSRTVKLNDIARRLGTIGNTGKGGGGHPHIGNFYWPHNPPKMDIWSLFKVNYLKGTNKRNRRNNRRNNSFL